MLADATHVAHHAGARTATQHVKNGDEQRVLILMDIEGLMSSADMGLIDSLH